VQPARRTVAGVLSEALERLRLDARGLTVAGRTDAGVHATGQGCHVGLDSARWEALEAGRGGTLVQRINALLPPDVRVYRIAPAPPGFDARFSALWRRYVYRLTDAPWGAPPLRHHDTVAWPRPLDCDRANAAAAGLLGLHEFAAYCRRREFATTLRTLNLLEWRRQPDGIVTVTVAADAFCQAMVRSLVGALLTVADGRNPVDWPASLLHRHERAGEVVVAPAHGLTLVEVGYPDDPAALAARAEKTRALRTTDATTG
jgi:tRNA pseudouridine38-40 synthase